MQVKDIVYTEEGHTYELNGVLLPSVTQIIQASGLVKYPPSAYPFLARAAERGRAVHAACDLYDDGVLEWESVQENYRPYVESYIKWREANDVTFLSTERVVSDGSVAGRLDRECSTAQGIAITDLKSASKVEKDGRPLLSYRVQLSAYARLAGYLGKEVERLILHLQKNGSIAREVWCTDDKDYDVWEWCKGLYLTKLEEGLLD